jgi:single-strand DNA-binding protein
MTIAGNVGKDAVLRKTQNGDSVLGFSIAVGQGKDKGGNKRDSVWVSCSIFGQRADSLQSYITKGSKLALSGKPSVNVYEGKGSLQLLVNELTFMGGGGERSEQGGYDQTPQSNVPDDEIPF